MPDGMAGAIRQRERAERYLGQALARRQHAEQAVAKALALRRPFDDGLSSRLPTAHRPTNAEATVTERRIARLAEPRDQLRYPELDVLNPYFLAVSDRETLLYALLDAALQHTRADMGNVQLFDPARRGLHIAAQRGFQQPFLDFFAWVGHGRSACGTAAARAQPVTVPDVARSVIFGSGPDREIVLDAHVRAVQSVPLVGSGGQLLGVFSTHYHKPGRPRAADSRLLAVLSHAAVRALQWNPSLNLGSRFRLPRRGLSTQPGPTDE